MKMSSQLHSLATFPRESLLYQYKWLGWLDVGHPLCIASSLTKLTHLLTCFPVYWRWKYEVQFESKFHSLIVTRDILPNTVSISLWLLGSCVLETVFEILFHWKQEEVPIWLLVVPKDERFTLRNSLLTSWELCSGQQYTSAENILPEENS